MDHPQSSFERLTDRELAVLRLLASGHTAKTIAAQLGLSEASINERLRDARRKTGVGSSRELARLVGKQKNWDKNFDLAASEHGADGSVQPARAGLNQPKGRSMMFISAAIATAALATIAAPSLHETAPVSREVAGRPGASALAGTWSLDTARIPADERPRHVTIAFRPLPDGRWTTMVDIIGASGASSHAESTAATDGVAVPITGSMSFIDTAALRQPSANTLVMTLGKDGSPVSTRVYTVAKDRNLMTETIVWPGDHLPKLETTYFVRRR